LNLLINALQSMPDGGTITVRTEASFPLSASRTAWTEVRIADDGPGIPPDQLRRVFDPFYTTKREGTGIGLAICYGIIEQHKGTIHLESTVGKGTTAFIRLPFYEGEGKGTDGEHPDRG
jgi:two-component system NtrC family sensor kinase